MGRLRRRFRMCWHGSALVRPAIAFAAAIFVMTGPAEAITLSRVDNMIHISGPIEIGAPERGHDAAFRLVGEVPDARPARPQGPGRAPALR